MSHPTIRFQVTTEGAPSPPSWMEELAAMAQVVHATGGSIAMEEHVPCARARCGTDDTMDGVFLLCADALSGEPPRIAFSDRLAPVTPEDLALCARTERPSRSALSRCVAALDEHTVDA
jgi:hypothetical protein